MKKNSSQTKWMRNGEYESTWTRHKSIIEPLKSDLFGLRILIDGKSKSGSRETYFSFLFYFSIG